MTKPKHRSVSKKKDNKDYSEATLAGVKKEMAKPRVAKSARKKYANMDLPVVMTEARKQSSREAAGRPLEGEPFQDSPGHYWQKPYPNWDAPNHFKS